MNTHRRNHTFMHTRFLVFITIQVITRMALCYALSRAVCIICYHLHTKNQYHYSEIIHQTLYSWTALHRYANSVVIIPTIQTVIIQYLFILSWCKWMLVIAYLFVCFMFEVSITIRSFAYIYSWASQTTIKSFLKI